MIESIYNNGGNGKKESGTAQAAFKPPKNIRQVGQAEGPAKIYVEDYVMSYIKQLAKEKNSRYELAILLGKSVHTEKEQNLFISGAIRINEIELQEQNTFSNEVWCEIYEKIKQYFTDVEIMGWFLTGTWVDTEPDEMIIKIHINNFAGQDKTLLLLNREEEVETFYLYKESSLKPQKGYYIYYERNEEMQNYMVENTKKVSKEAEYNDTAVQKIREIIENKKEEKPSKKMAGLVYAGGTLIAVVLLIIGAAVLSNYGQMKNIEQALNVISDHLKGTAQTLKEEQTKAPTNQPSIQPEEKVVTVETLSGQVKKKDTAKDKEKGKVKEIDTKPKKTPTPTPSPKPKKTIKPKKRTKKKIDYYFVKKGDSLASISMKRYKTLTYVKKIKEANHLTDQDYIVEGQKLIMP